MTTRETQPAVASPATTSTTPAPTPPGSDRATQPRRGAGALATATAIALVWLVTLPRMVPSLFGDHGSYISMAERLLAGDRLYVDAIDNKGPLYYAELALGRFVSPYADIALEVGWVLIACLAVRALATSAGVGTRIGLVAAFAGVPIVVTGNAYGAGMTHLPGVALCLAVAALAARRHWVVAGLLTGALLLSKEIMVPIAVAAVLTAAWHRRTWLGVAWAALSALVVAAVGIGALWVRGELGGLVAILASNVQYAEGTLSESRYGSFVGHLLNAIPEDGRGGGLITISAVLLVLVAVGRDGSPGWAGRSADHDEAPLVTPALGWDLTAATLVAAILVIGASAPWAHHSQSLYIAGCLALVLVARRLTHGDVERPPAGGGLAATAPWRAVGVVVLAAFITGGTLHPYYYLESAREVPGRVAALGRESVESAVLAQQPEVRTYARAGANDDGAHAVGLGSLDLVCPRFHHYSFEGKAVFDQIFACLSTADALIVDQNVRDELDRPDWNAYVAQVRRLISSGYTCVPTSRSQVCIKDELYVAPGTTPAR